MKMNISKVTELNFEDVVNILSGFMETSSYWCSEVTWDDEKYSEARKRLVSTSEEPEDICFEEILAEMLMFSPDNKLILEDIEGEENTLTLEVILKGINTSLKSDGLSADPDDWDGEDTDCIIQNAVFGQVIYG